MINVEQTGNMSYISNAFNGDYNEKKKSAFNLPKGNERFTTCSLYY